MDKMHCKEEKKRGAKIKGKPTIAKKTMLNQMFKKKHTSSRLDRSI
jgi:hypothetical protein